MAKKRQPRKKPTPTPKPTPKAAKPPEAESSPPPKKDAGLKSVAELAQLTGVSPGQIAVAVRTGFVAPAQRGRYQLGPALVGLIKFLNARVGTLPTYDNVEQCASATGIPVSVIKQARRSKQLGPVGGIPLAPLLKVLFEEHGENWAEMQNKFSALREKGRYEQEAGELLPKTDVARAIAKGTALLFGLIDRQATLEFPPMLVGLNERECQNVLVTGAESLKANFKNELDHLTGNGNGKISEDSIGTRNMGGEKISP
jgi:hypothetical protein